MRAMNVVVACVLCAIGVTGCGTLSSGSRAADALSPSAVAAVAAPATESVAADVQPIASDGHVVASDGRAVASDDLAPAPPAEVAEATPAADARETTPPNAEPEAASTSAALASADDRFDDMVALLMQSAARPTDDDAIPEEYDPWEKFNEKTFEFNRRLDRYVLKPVAKAYDKVIPDRLQNMIGNGFDNIRWVPRFVNSMLQAKWNGAGREVGRFVINSTLGIAGLFDIAKQEFGIEKSREDFGQTLGVWGAGPGPFLVLPLLPPLTVRDAVGFVVDGAMNPLTYVLPFFWDRFGMAVGDAINDRSLNLELYQGFEETVIDMYSAVRHGYLQRREQMIKE